jgi:hypothetical protein
MFDMSRFDKLSLLLNMVEIVVLNLLQSCLFFFRQGNLKKLLAKAESELSNRVCSGVMMVLHTTVSASSGCCCGDDSVLLWLQPYWLHQTHHADHLPVRPLIPRLSIFSAWSSFHVQNFACISKEMNIFTSCPGTLVCCNY